MSKDINNPAANPFAYHETSEGRVRISFIGQNIMTLKDIKQRSSLRK